MLLIIIRAVFVLVVASLAAQVARVAGLRELMNPAVGFFGVMLVAIGVVLVDLLTPRKRVQAISAVYFGLIVGLILSFALNLAIDPTLKWLTGPPHDAELPQTIKLMIQVIICYVCVSTLLQTKDDFRFIIPYMEFSREVKGARPLVLDTSVIIDGRIADVAETRVIDQPLVIPRFVLQELQGIADSSDKLRRNRGRRGLDILNRLQKSSGVEVRIHDSDIPELAGIREVDQRPGRPGQEPRRQGRHQRLQPQQDRPPPGGRGHQPQRPGQRDEADRPARRGPDGQAHQARRGAGPGDRLPRRRHDGRHRAGRPPPRGDGPTDRHQRPPDQRRPDDLRQGRALRPRPQSRPLAGLPAPREPRQAGELRDG